jgi:hypothetical protein
MTAAMALLVGPSGHVVGVDKVVELVQASLASVAASNPELLGQEEGQQQMQQQQGGQQGIGEEQPRVTFVHGNVLAGKAARNMGTKIGRQPVWENSGRSS